MPGGDRTGPAGMGPMTGRAAGYCAGYPVPGFMNPIPGRGFGGWGRGRGRGFGRGWGGGPGWGAAAPMAYGAPYGAAYGAPYGGAYGAPYGAAYGAPYAPQPDPKAEADALKGQVEYLEDVLDGIRKRMAELETEKEE